MKDYRKLAEGETIREGDEYASKVLFGFWDPDARVGSTPKQHGHDYRRLARTDGCPVGWRWADYKERSANVLNQDLSITPRLTGDVRTDSARDVFRFNSSKFPCYVMPYPEDPRHTSS